MSPSQSEEELSAELCPKCGTLMEQDDRGELFCPKCAGEIDWGLEDEEPDDK
jgi:uncharacterized Zn finger protein (UPF0148 family)